MISIMMVTQLFSHCPQNSNFKVISHLILVCGLDKKLTLGAVLHGWSPCSMAD
jgi:hypothetical protein